MIRALLAVLGMAGTALMTYLWALELRRSQEREQVLFDQIGMFEERLGIPISQRVTPEILGG